MEPNGEITEEKILQINAEAVRAITLRTLLKQVTDKLDEDWAATPPLPDAVGVNHLTYSMYVGFNFDGESDIGLAIQEYLKNMGMELQDHSDNRITYILPTGAL